MLPLFKAGREVLKHSRKPPKLLISTFPPDAHRNTSKISIPCPMELKSPSITQRRQMGVSPKASSPKKKKKLGHTAERWQQTGLRSARREAGQEAKSSLCFFQGGATPMPSRYKSVLLLFCLRKLLNSIKSPQTVTQQQQH